MKKYHTSNLDIQIPEGCRVLQKDGGFYAERKKPFLQIAVSYDEGSEIYECTRDHLKRDPVDTEQIRPTILKNHALVGHREGWELISENTTLATGAVGFCWAVIYMVGHEKSVYIELGGDGLFEGNREMMQVIMDSIVVRF